MNAVVDEPPGCYGTVMNTVVDEPPGCYRTVMNAVVDQPPGCNRTVMNALVDESCGCYGTVMNAYANPECKNQILELEFEFEAKCVSKKQLPVNCCLFRMFCFVSKIHTSF